MEPQNHFEVNWIKRFCGNAVIEFRDLLKIVVELYECRIELNSNFMISNSSKLNDIMYISISYGGSFILSAVLFRSESSSSSVVYVYKLPLHSSILPLNKFRI